MTLSEVKLGLIGAGTGVTEKIAAALQQQGKLRLVELFDPCLFSAQVEARQIDAQYSPSLDGLLRRTNGIVVADVKWMGPEPLVRAAGLQRPALILSSVFCRFSLEQLQRLQHFSELTSTLLMPELSYRWARSTLRLRELTATRLQAIEQMELTCACSPGSDAELMVFDWCLNVVQSKCLTICSDSNGTEIQLEFWRKQQDGTPVTVHLHLQPTASADPVPAFPIVDCRIRCKRGTVRLTSELDLTWEQPGRPDQVESLQSDRSAEHLMYDLFGRRLVGGLVPVPDISDLIRAGSIRLARDLSRQEQREISIETIRA